MAQPQTSGATVVDKGISQTPWHCDSAQGDQKASCAVDGGTTKETGSEQAHTHRQSGLAREHSLLRWSLHHRHVPFRDISTALSTLQAKVCMTCLVLRDQHL